MNTFDLEKSPSRVYYNNSLKMIKIFQFLKVDDMIYVMPLHTGVCFMCEEAQGLSYQILKKTERHFLITYSVPIDHRRYCS